MSNYEIEHLYRPEINALLLSNPTLLIHRGQEKLQEGDSISYDKSRDIHVMGNPSSSLVFIANGGDVSMNETPVLEETLAGKTTTLDIGDAMDGPILFHQTTANDTFVYREYGPDAPDPEYNAQLLHNIQKGLASIGVDTAQNICEVPSITKYLKESRPSDSYVPHILSPRIFGKSHEGQAMIHMGLYTKSGFQQMCQYRGIPTPPTEHVLYDGKNADVCAQYIMEAFFLDYPELVTSQQTGCSGEGVFFTPNKLPALKALIQSKFGQSEITKLFGHPEMMMVQGRIPPEDLQNSPCYRAYIGNDEIVPISVTMQRIVNGGYSGNTWSRDTAGYLEELSPGFNEVNLATLQMLQDTGVRGIVNLDSMIVTQKGANRLKLAHTTVMREGNIRPAFSHPLGRQSTGEINGLSVDQIQTNFRVYTPDEWYYDKQMLQNLNEYTGNDIKAFLGLRYPSWASSDPGRTYVVFAANERVSKEELDEVHQKTLKKFMK